MARIISNSVNFSLNGISLEGELNSVSQSASIPEGDVTSFNDVWQNFVAGKKNITTEISGSIDPLQGTSAGDQTLFESFGAGPQSTVFDPSGAGPDANNPQYQCTSSGLAGVLVASYSISLPVGGAGTYSATLQHSALTTRAVA